MLERPRRGLGRVPGGFRGRGCLGIRGPRGALDYQRGTRTLCRGRAREPDGECLAGAAFPDLDVAVDTVSGAKGVRAARRAAR